MEKLFKDLDIIKIILLDKPFYYYKKDERLFLFFELKEGMSISEIRLFLTDLSTKEKRTEIK